VSTAEIVVAVILGVPVAVVFTVAVVTGIRVTFFPTPEDAEAWLDRWAD
jgi:hypothetical protein